MNAPQSTTRKRLKLRHVDWQRRLDGTVSLDSLFVSHLLSSGYFPVEQSDKWVSTERKKERKEGREGGREGRTRSDCNKFALKTNMTIKEKGGNSQNKRIFIRPLSLLLLFYYLFFYSAYRFRWVLLPWSTYFEMSQFQELVKFFWN